MHHHHHSSHKNSTLAQSATQTSQSSPARVLSAATETEAAQDPKPQRAVPAGEQEARIPTPAAPRRHARMVATTQARPSTLTAVGPKQEGVQATDEHILEKIRHLEKELDEEEKALKIAWAKGHLKVNGPLPLDFSDRFAEGVAEATGCVANDVELLGAVPVPEAQASLEDIVFRSRSDVVAAVEEQAANPESKLASGVLHMFLVARDEPGEESEESEESEPQLEPDIAGQKLDPKAPPQRTVAPEVDMSMPYGDLEPFGREDTAQELTESSIRESNAMVDQLEKAEVAEEKRAVFRALTRLRGAAITSYDGIARSQTGNIDDYARKNQWRNVHPVHHLADDEADVSKWAFPDAGED